MYRLLGTAMLVAAALAGVEIAPAAEPLSVCLAHERLAVAVRAASVGLDGQVRSAQRDAEVLAIVEDAVRRFGSGVFATRARLTDAADISALVRPLDEAADRRASLLLAVSLEAREYPLPSEFSLGPSSRTVAISFSVTAVDVNARDVVATRSAPVRNVVARSTGEALTQLFIERGAYADVLADLLTQACERRQVAPVPPIVEAALPQQPDPPDPPTAPRSTAAARGADRPRPLVAGAPERHRALVVGISDYRALDAPEGTPAADLLDLKYANRDARAFIDFLRDKRRSGGDWEIFDYIDAEATQGKIDSAMMEVFSHARPGDVVMFFFSGHGRADPANQEIYLLPYDFDPSYGGSGLSYVRIKGMMEASPALQIVSFIDACHSGVSTIGKGEASAFDVDRLNIESRTGRMRTVFASGTGHERSYEFDELQHGVFTYFLLDALSGKVQELKDHKVLSMRKVSEYVSSKVTDYSRRHHDKMQHPRVLYDYGEQFDTWPIGMNR